MKTTDLFFNFHPSKIDVFEVDDVHYSFIDAKMSHASSARLCKTFHEELVIIKDIELATTLAEALSESNLIIDSLWTSATLDNDNEWKWYSSVNNSKLTVDERIKEEFVYHKKIKRNDRKCLAFSRNNHDEPQFRPLPCEANRAVFCQRPGKILFSSSVYYTYLEQSIVLYYVVIRSVLF